jgi:hypothetical protein
MLGRPYANKPPYLTYAFMNLVLPGDSLCIGQNVAEVPGVAVQVFWCTVPHL